MKKLPLDPHTELFRWGPIPGRAFYMTDFLTGIFDKRYFRTAFPGELWPNGMALFKGGRMVFVNEFRDLYQYGGSVFENFMLPIEKRAEIYQNYLGHIARLEAKEKEIDSLTLSTLSPEDFLKLWHDFHQITIGMWTDTTIPELANYGSLPILEKELRAVISDESEIHHVMEVLTAPLRSSFYQEEEIDLAESNDITAHQQKYFWLKNSYAGVETLDVHFFEQRKNGHPQSPRKDIEAKRQSTVNRKQEVISKYTLSKKITDIADAIVNGIEWQDERKAHIWKYLYYKNLLLEEVSKRINIPLHDLLDSRELEIEAMLEGQLDLEKIIETRKKDAFGFLAQDGELVTLTQDEAAEFWDIYSEEKAGEGVKELRGTVASKGPHSKIIGPVHIILDPKDADTFKEGSVLIAPMTTPDYVFVMKRCAAIITDAGGLTSHAAIVSRELQKPCIVGTKIATKVLKDGDMVEVDADKGIVKIIK